MSYGTFPKTAKNENILKWNSFVPKENDFFHKLKLALQPDNVKL